MQMRKAIRSSAIAQMNNPDNINNIKKTLVNRQHGICPITGRDLRAMSPSNVVVDHCHKSGVIRAALPRAINGLEGKLTQACLRWAGVSSTEEVIRLLRKMADYLELHRVPQTEWIHPDHMTATEKRHKLNEKARKKYALDKSKKV